MDFAAKCHGSQKGEKSANPKKKTNYRSDNELGKNHTVLVHRGRKKIRPRSNPASRWDLLKLKAGGKTPPPQEGQELQSPSPLNADLKGPGKKVNMRFFARIEF